MITRREVRRRMKSWDVHTIGETVASTYLHSNIVYRGRFYSTSTWYRGESFARNAALLHSMILRDLKEPACAISSSTSKPS